jgi:hypothetical protein
MLEDIQLTFLNDNPTLRFIMMGAAARSPRPLAHLERLATVSRDGGRVEVEGAVALGDEEERVRGLCELAIVVDGGAIIEVKLGGGAGEQWQREHEGNGDRGIGRWRGQEERTRYEEGEVEQHHKLRGGPGLREEEEGLLSPRRRRRTSTNREGGGKCAPHEEKEESDDRYWPPFHYWSSGLRRE